MKKKRQNIVIIGASGHARVIIDIIEKNDLYSIIGLIDSFKTKDTMVYEYPILGTEKDLISLTKQYNFSAGFIAIGDNWTRKFLHEKIEEQLPNFEFISVIHPNVSIGKNVRIGKGTCLMAGVIVNSDTTIGDFCILNTNSSLDHDGNMADYSSLAPNATLGGRVSIGKCSAISLGANIIQDISVGDFSIVGAGSLVIKDIGDLQLAFGVPVKKIRDIIKGSKYLYKKESVTNSSILYEKSNLTEDINANYIPVGGIEIFGNNFLDFTKNENIIPKINHDKYKKENLAYLVPKIKSNTLFKLVTPPENSIFGLELLFDNRTNFNELKNHLEKNNIYPSELCHENTLSTKFKYFLNIHVDFRYKKSDMDQIAISLNNWINLKNMNKLILENK